MSWWLGPLIFVCEVFCGIVGWRCGARSERMKQASREEAIRRQAYKDGLDSCWKANMTHEEFQRMYMGTWSTDKSDETREGC